jgi:tetratricopeptide (TPR) repeat protein
MPVYLYRFLVLSVSLWLTSQPLWADRISEMASEASALASSGYTNAAIDIYQRAIVMDSQNPLPRQMSALHFNIALLFMDKRQFELAVAALEQTIKIDPNHLKGHFNLGILYADLKRKPEAEKELSTALALAAGNPSLTRDIISILQDRKLTGSIPTSATPNPPASPASGSDTAPPGTPSP